MRNKQPKDKNISLAINIFAIVIGMLGMAYASVPLYNLFCRVTGFGGTIQESKQFPEKILDKEITIRFDANIDNNIPWEFKPGKNQVKIKIGDKGFTHYSAVNKSDKAIKGTSVYNVTPPEAGAYFNKVQCFCFEEQILEPNQKANFPVSFFVDPEIVNDKNTRNINTITLSYTFFRVKDDK